MWFYFWRFLMKKWFMFIMLIVARENRKMKYDIYVIPKVMTNLENGTNNPVQSLTVLFSLQSHDWTSSAWQHSFIYSVCSILWSHDSILWRFCQKSVLISGFQQTIASLMTIVLITALQLPCSFNDYCKKCHRIRSVTWLWQLYHNQDIWE